MSIAKFNTIVPSVPTASTGSAGGGSSKVLATILIAAAAIFIGYKFIYLPMKARREAEQNQED